jgi:hypothetical protein
MIFSENRYPPRIKSGAGFFGITLYLHATLVGSTLQATFALPLVS